MLGRVGKGRVTEAYNRAAHHAENILGYKNLEIEKAAYARHEAFDLEQELRFARRRCQV